MLRTSHTLQGATFLLTLALGAAIKCYVCNNGKTDACGLDFKSYQYMASDCPQPNAKCGKQTQPPITHNGKENWIGVIRSCYPMGTLPGINETDGCHNWTNPRENFTATYCFCSHDSCNHAAVIHGNTVSVATTIVTVALCGFMYRFLSCL